MIELKAVSMKYGDVSAVQGVDITIERGARIALAGASGSGKTSLLRLIAGLEVPDSGEVAISGRTCSSPDVYIPPGRRGIGFVFQEPSLWPHLSVFRNVAYGLENPGSRESRDRVVEVLKRLGLSDLARRKPHQLSGGEAQRASIARALAPSPPVQLMDEPLTGLDDELKSSVIDFLVGEFESRGTTVLMAAHDEAAAGKLCRGVVRMERGRIVSSAGWDGDRQAAKDSGR